MTGVRVSEGLSLWWEDVDFEHKFLKVYTTLEKDREIGNWYPQRPNQNTSWRTPY